MVKRERERCKGKKEREVQLINKILSLIIDRVTHTQKKERKAKGDKPHASDTHFFIGKEGKETEREGRKSFK